MFAKSGFLKNTLAVSQKEVAVVHYISSFWTSSCYDYWINTYFEKCKIVKMGGNIMKNKLERFVASLTDQEIDCQLKDVLEWARVYKELLEAEQSYRCKNRNVNQSSSLANFDEDESIYEEANDNSFDENVTEYMSVDFELAQMVQQKVSAFSVEKTKEQIEKLKQVPTYSLTPQDLAQLKYEIEICELHLFELTGENPNSFNVCPSCGAELEANAKFCGECGTSIKEM